MSNKEVIKKLESLDLATVSVEEVREIISGLSPKFLRMSVSGHFFIERLRLGVGYTARCDVSYKTGSETDDWNRATIPGRSIFYGTIAHPEENSTNRRLIAICESSKLFRQGPTVSGKEEYILSRWFPVRDLQLGVIVSNDVYKNKTNRILDDAKTYISSQDLSSTDTETQLSDFLNYAAKEFSKKVAPNERYNYKITAAIADYMMYSCGLDGIIYPSVQTGGEAGMNIALKKECVDEALKLETVVELVYEQNFKKSNLNITRHIIPFEKDKLGLLSWEWK